MEQKQKDSPKVSIIIPVYKVEKYIKRCIDSLFGQTLTDLEFIFVDDCSPDKSVEVLEAEIENKRLHFIEKNWNVRIVKMPTNSGLPAVRRHGTQLATGEYLIHCDSDDWVDEDMYRLLYEKAKLEDADVVVCDYATVDEQNTIVHKGCIHKDTDSFIYDCCRTSISWSACNKLVKTSLLKSDFSFPFGNMGEDMAITLQVLLKANKLEYVPCSLYYYYTNLESITKKVTEQSVWDKYLQFKGNVELVLPLMNDQKYTDCVLLLKWRARQHILGLVHKKQYFDAWKNTYPEIDKHLFSNHDISVKDKIRYVLTLLHVYPFSNNRIKVE